MENKKCYNCKIILIPENKIKNRNLCKSCSSIITKNYKMNNKEKISEYNKKYKSEHKEDISDYNKNYNISNRDQIQKKQTLNNKLRREVDHSYRISGNCRNKIKKLIKGQLQSFKLLNCSKDFLLKWLEYNFDENMNFKNYGSYWHIDHVIPCAKFNFTNEEDVKFCVSWTNLQPLEAKLNLSKNDKIDKELIKLHYKKVQEFANKNNISIDNICYHKYL